MSAQFSSANELSRRRALQLLGAFGLAATGAGGRAWAQVAAQVDEALPLMASAEPLASWNALGPLVALPQKVPLIQLTDRPVQLETPRQYFSTVRTPNAAFFV